jgi:probable poly-beta-1,6-N-acetyl-D-glucosamine export protein
MQKKEFLNYIHYFRGLAILFIVGLHAAAMPHWENDKLRKAFIVPFNNGTVLFVFIAGFLFYYLNHQRFKYFEYLKKKFMYVIVPYLIVSIPAIIDKLFFERVGEHWWMDSNYHSYPAPVKVLWLLITGRHMGVFWFIPMISIIYLLAPLILRFAKTNTFLYITPVLVIVSLFTFRFGYYANIGISLIYFFPTYLFGIWLCRQRELMFAHARVLAWSLVGAYLVLSVCEFMNWVPFHETVGRPEGNSDWSQFNVNKFKMTLLCVGGLAALYLVQNAKIPFLKILGDYSFGIFFVHLYVLLAFRVMDRKGYLNISPPNVVTFLLYFMAVVLLSVGVVKVVKLCLRNNSRYVIGS